MHKMTNKHIPSPCTRMQEESKRKCVERIWNQAIMTLFQDSGTDCKCVAKELWLRCVYDYTKAYIKYTIMYTQGMFIVARSGEELGDPLVFLWYDKETELWRGNIKKEVEDTVSPGCNACVWGCAASYIQC